MLLAMVIITSFLFSYLTDKCNCCYDVFYKMIQIRKVPSIMSYDDLSLFCFMYKLTSMKVMSTFNTKLRILISCI